MKKVVSVIGCLSLFSCQLTMADALKLYMVAKVETSGKTIPLYRFPTKHSEIITSIPLHSKWLIERDRPKIYGERVWRKISWKNRRGWVLSQHLKYDPDTSLIANKPDCQAKKENAKGCKSTQ